MLGAGYEVVAINDLWDTGMLAHLLVHDSTFGRLAHEVGVDDTMLTVAGMTIPATSSATRRRACSTRA
jgi:glyceraldehyde 3-phosphate dehydrogenase